MREFKFSKATLFRACFYSNKVLQNIHFAFSYKSVIGKCREIENGELKEYNEKRGTLDGLFTPDMILIEL